jgi:hypothetical protein
VPELKVKSRNSVFRCKGKEVDVQKVGKDLTVDALLTGTVMQHGDTIQVTADLTNVQDNTEIWGEHYERKASDIMTLQEQIAGDLAQRLRSGMSGAEKQQVTKQGTQNPEAYQLYVKGRYYFAAAAEAGFRSGGWPAALRKGIEVSLARRKAKTGYVSSHQIAQYYADLGDKDHAFEWLNTAFQEHDTALTALRTDFLLDSLHPDPRYAEVVRKIGLPQ